METGSTAAADQNHDLEPIVNLISASALQVLRSSRIRPLYWVGLAVVLAFVDNFLGPSVQFPIVFVIPVGLAAWYSGRWWGVALAIVLPIVRFYSVTEAEPAAGLGSAAINAGIRIAILTGLAVLLDRLASHERALSQKVATLEGLLPICSGCKKIRDEEQRWQPLEDYIGQRSSAQFTHGLCPTCIPQYFGEYADEVD